MDVRLSNYVRGTIVDSNSKPLRSVCVELADVTEERGWCHALTDKKGRFRINSVKAGNYFLILNQENKRTQEMPFPRLYYPGVMEREKATMLSVKHGQSLNNLNVVISERTPVQE
jgi:hypothetical protein